MKRSLSFEDLRLLFDKYIKPNIKDTVIGFINEEGDIIGAIQMDSELSVYVNFYRAKWDTVNKEYTIGVVRCDPVYLMPKYLKAIVQS